MTYYIVVKGSLVYRDYLKHDGRWGRSPFHLMEFPAREAAAEEARKHDGARVLKRTREDR